MISSDSLSVRGASYAIVTFNTNAPEMSELVIQHECNGKLLALERRPIPADVNSLEIKTHPDSLQIKCSLIVAQASNKSVCFSVECTDSIEPTGRYFIVIGAMKAGTTTLFHLLAQHPAVCRTYSILPGASDPKEINYFQKLYKKDDTALHYDWRFPFDPSRHEWTLDVSPNYAKLPMGKHVPGRIAALGGRTKLAYVLRDPVDRIESHIAQTLRKTGRKPKIEACIRTSQYALHLDRFSEQIPRDDILLLDFRELTRDPASALARACNFLGIQPFNPRLEIHNTRGIEFELSPSERVQLTKSLRSDIRRLIKEYGFEPAKNWLQPISPN